MMGPNRRLAGVAVILVLLLAVVLLAGNVWLPGNTVITAVTSDTGPTTVSPGATPSATPVATQAPMPANSPLAGSILINEVAASNHTSLQDENGDHPDWIELSNVADAAIDLAGCVLIDNAASPDCWVLPAVVLQPGGFLVIFASGKDRTGEYLHANFTLDRKQDVLELQDRDGLRVDRVTLGENPADVSWGRVAGTAGSWLYYPEPTPGRANTTRGYAGDALAAGAVLQITEAMNWNISTLDDQNGDYPDWIEIYNSGAAPVDLLEYGLADRSGGLAAWRFPEMTLAPGAYLVVFASGKNLRNPQEPLHTDFALGKNGETVYLLNPIGQVVDRLQIGRLEAGVSYGRAPADASQWLWFANPTPGRANDGSGFLGYTGAPVFSLASGFYQGRQQLALASRQPDAQIRYTLDGSLPTAGSPLYTAPITIDRTTVVRALTFRDGYRPGLPATNTYFIDDSHTISVVSLALDPRSFDDPTVGIYSKGPGASATFPYMGANFWKETEIPCAFQLFEKGGALGFQMNVGIQIFGGWTRAYDQKSFALYARNRYEKDVMNYPFLVNKNVTQFKQLVLRSAGQDVLRSKIRDILATRLMEGTNLFYQGYRFVSLYINGRYWGLYSIREKANRYFIHYNMGIDDLDTIDILTGNGAVQTGDGSSYKALLAYVKEHDMADAANYAYVQTQMDVDNYMNYIIMMMYAANVDSGNIRFWREDTEDGLWRWFIYDMDLGFGAGATAVHDTFAFLTDPGGTGAGGSFSTVLINGLLRNAEFRQAFIERFAYHLNHTFASGRVISVIDALAGEIEPEMTLNVQRWTRPASVDDWQREVENLRSFARRRPAIIWQYVCQHLNLDAAQSALYHEGG